jgi:hypothetical protein
MGKGLPGGHRHAGRIDYRTEPNRSVLPDRPRRAQQSGRGSSRRGPQQVRVTDCSLWQPQPATAAVEWCPQPAGCGTKGWGWEKDVSAQPRRGAASAALRWGGALARRRRDDDQGGAAAASTGSMWRPTHSYPATPGGARRRHGAGRLRRGCADERCQLGRAVDTDPSLPWGAVQQRRPLPRPQAAAGGQPRPPGTRLLFGRCVLHRYLR